MRTSLRLAPSLPTEFKARIPKHRNAVTISSSTLQYLVRYFCEKSAFDLSSHRMVQLPNLPHCSSLDPTNCHIDGHSFCQSFSPRKAWRRFLGRRLCRRETRTRPLLAFVICTPNHPYYSGWRQVRASSTSNTQRPCERFLHLWQLRRGRELYLDLRTKSNVRRSQRRAVSEALYNRYLGPVTCGAIK